MTKHDLIEHSSPCRYLAAHCNIKQYKFDEALAILGEKNPTNLISTTSKQRRKLQHTGGNTRNGVAKISKRPERMERSEERDREDASDLKFQAAMCYLRGICYAKQNAFDRAKECYKDAVRIDVQCFEAFDQLMKNNLMPPAEEWEFLESLDFDSIQASDPSTSQEAAQFVKMLYTTRLSKYKNPTEFSNATETLSTHYRLADNHDLLLAKADLLFVQCRFKDAHAITASILESDQFNFTVYPLHLACLYELRETNTLFLLSHRLADLHPEEPATWLAVGVYYLATNKIAEARRFFSKASVLDAHFGPAWIGFAHTFAAEGEHDQAVAAYSTALRLFQGTHLPHLFLGMQHLALHNLALAAEYLAAAHALCPDDPLLLNELGVVAYHRGDLEPATQYFARALELADAVGADPQAWAPTRANLAHAYRRQGDWEPALAEYDAVLRLAGRDCGVFCAKGLVLLEMERPFEAACALHEALAVQPQDPIATDLLGRALEELARSGHVGGRDVPPGDAHDRAVAAEFESFVRQKREASKGAMKRIEARRKEKRAAGAKGKGKASMGSVGMVEDSMMELSEDDEP